MNNETFVLPLGGSLVAAGGAPVSLNFSADLNLSAQALAARYAGEWLASKLQIRGRALGARVSNCATSAQGVVKSGAYNEDILRSALGTQSCVKLVDDVLRDERGVAPAIDDAVRARKEIVGLAKLVLADEFISRAVKVLAR